MTSCSDVETRLDAFVDSELSPTEQIDVARHLAGCPPCDAAVERLLTLRERLCAMTDAVTASLPSVWPAVSERIDAEVRWRSRRARAPLGAMPMWAAGMAMAAAALLFLRVMGSGGDVAPPRAERMARSAVIERVVGNVDVRRDVKSGAPIILVNHAGKARAR